jgi:GT2 family glycosyltransferase
MKNPSVAIIILNYNNQEYTVDCLKSLKDITYGNYKVFLVDNGSEKDDIEKLKTGLQNIDVSKFKAFDFLEHHPNNGFSGGNNVGIKKALEENFDYILLLNNDTTVEPDFVDEMVKAAESDKKIGAVGPKIYFHPDMIKNNEEVTDCTNEEVLEHPKDLIKEKNDLLIWYAGGGFSWFGGGKHYGLDEVDVNPEESKIKETKYITGCAFLIKKEVIDKVGIMPEEFFLYYEDVDWSLSVKKAGYKLVYAPAAKVYHKVSRTTKKMGNPMIHYYHIRNALLISKRQAPKVILAGIYVWSALHYLKQILKLVILPKKRESTKMIMRGIEDFYNNKFGKYETR